MKVITLLQPWASLVAHGVKRWETRGWKPGPDMLPILRQEGLLIHASVSRKCAHFMGVAPFCKYLSRLGRMPYGAIIAHARLGRIITTEQWITDHSPSLACNSDKWRNEKCFGDYDPGRYAWELLNVRRLAEPIPYSGSLSVWDYPYDIKIDIEPSQKD